MKQIDCHFNGFSEDEIEQFIDRMQGLLGQNTFIDASLVECRATITILDEVDDN